jgi:hypothetical protein
MPILKKAIKRKRTSESAAFLGLTLPRKVATLLSLYSISHGVTKSSIVKALIETWIRSDVDPIENDLVINIAQKSYHFWSHPNGKRMNYHTFKTDLKNELISKGLDVYVDKILTLIDDEKSKDEGCPTA